MNEQDTKRRRTDRPEKKTGRAKRADTLKAPKKLKLLFTVVDRKKAELYADLLGDYSVNLQIVLPGEGTAKTETLRLLGLDDTARAVIVSVIRDDLAPAIFEMLEEKFRTVRGGKGIAWSVPMTSAVGVAIYQFLSDYRDDPAKANERGIRS
ncbi:MAG: hypothetical protein J5958_04140 [Clostridia bacterium]|nr:hypothetical protein [Clostridia bacterium]MBR5044202.1 hypothetical protein [Clostridia bacterium]